MLLYFFYFDLFVSDSLSCLLTFLICFISFSFCFVLTNPLGEMCVCVYRGKWEEDELVIQEELQYVTHSVGLGELK